MQWFQQQALALILPYVIGAISSYLYQKLKKAVQWIDERDPQTHAIITGAIAIVLPFIGKIIPGWTATDLGGLDATTIQQVVAWLAMQLTHKKLSRG